MSKKKKNLARVGFFFLTLKVIASSTQFFSILENFDIQRRTWRKSKSQTTK